ncbi:hypothetical protein FY137_22165 [Agrobacterium tumefaciens]|nr:hypothetical protein FY137_22165 [Agrobacterium tumefaciens]
MSSVTPKLDSCGAESIHIPDAIQEHGALLVLSARELSVVQFLSIRFLPGKLILFGRRPGRAKRPATRAMALKMEVVTTLPEELFLLQTMGA